MTSVVDASVLVAASVKIGPDGQWAEIIVGGESMAGPEFALVEATNILRRLELSRDISSREARDGLLDLLRMPIRLFPFRPFVERIWQLRSNLTCYDAWYVALAEVLNCPLITLDRRLSRSTGPTCEFVTPPPRQTSE